MTFFADTRSCRARSLLLAIGLLVAVVLLWPGQASARPPKQWLVMVKVSPASIYGGSASTATISYTLIRKAHVSVVVTNHSRRVVRVIQPDAVRPAGPYALTWDGTDEGGALLPPGNYSVVVTYSDGYHTEEHTEPVQLVSPVLTAVGVAPTVFYIGDSTTLTYTLTGPATVEVSVKDGEGTKVRALQLSFQGAGTYNVPWDGTDDEGTAVAAGDYTMVASATTAIGTVESTRVVRAVAPPLADVEVAPPAFYVGHSTTVSYTLTGPATVAVSIHDASDAEVRALQAGTAKTAGSYDVAWDGTADGGLPLPPGDYTVVVSATTAAGTREVTKAVQLVAPVLSGVSVLPDAFYAETGSTTLSYTLLGPATVAVSVLDSSDATVRVVQTATAQTAGSYGVTWNGRDGGGAVLQSGSYTMVLTATTAIGTVRSEQAVELLPLDVITDANVTPALFYGGAGASGRATLSYTLQAAATVAVVVRDQAGAPVKTLQPPTVQAAGPYTVDWDGTGDGGANLPEDQYAIVASATTATGTTERSDAVQFLLTPLATEISLGVDGAQGFALHAVVDKWSELLNGQTSANYYFDGAIQPWEFGSIEGASMHLYVGTDPSVPTDTTFGGTTSDTSGANGTVDLQFPEGLSWVGQGGVPRSLYYSVALSYGGSTRWYPATGRYPLRPPADAQGHVQFAFMTDIQTPLSAVPAPNYEPNAMTAATGPYTAIPRLSRSLGWSAVLSGLVQETDTNLVLYGGDVIDRGADDTAPDNGGVQYRTIFDNQQSYDSADEWSLCRLSNLVPLALAPGNHDDIGVNASANNRWNRWVYRPGGVPYYSFDKGDVHFVILDGYLASDDPSTDYTGWIGFQDDTVGGSRTVSVNGSDSTFANSPQADWLIGAIDTEKPWTVVVLHYPLFDAYRTSGAAYNEANTTGAVTSTNKYYYGERDRLLEFFAAHGVDVVLGGHNHNYRRHVEKVRSADGSVTSTMTFITQSTAGGPPTWRDTSSYLPYIDWIDYDGDGAPDRTEPVATAENSTHWDASAFGKENAPVSDSGYNGVPDMFHATGQEYDNDIRFSYSVFQTGSEAGGEPTLTLDVKYVSWNDNANAWNPWTIYESVQIDQVEPGMVADRFVQ